MEAKSQQCIEPLLRVTHIHLQKHIHVQICVCIHLQETKRNPQGNTRDPVQEVLSMGSLGDQHQSGHELRWRFCTRASYAEPELSKVPSSRTVLKLFCQTSKAKRHEEPDLCIVLFLNSKWPYAPWVQLAYRTLGQQRIVLHGFAIACLQALVHTMLLLEVTPGDLRTAPKHPSSQIQAPPSLP